MKSVGILGGTFDPIHHGHLITAQALLELRNLEKIVFIPCYISPHKTDGNNSSGLHRLKMVELAIRNYPCFTCSPIEVEREGISFTIDTLRQLSYEYENMELIIGYDNLEKFYTWKEPDEILKIAKLIVMKREIENRDFKRDRFYEAATFVKTPVIDIKATRIRDRVRQNLPVDFLVPKEIKEYIIINNLYK